MGPRAELDIPRYIDEYNYNMGGVDIADQHRSAFKTQRKAMRNWLPHWYWMLDYAIINAFKMAVYAPGSHYTKRQHRAFRSRLFEELFEFYSTGEMTRQRSMLRSQRLDPYVPHVYVTLSATSHPCAWCSHEKALNTSRSRTPSPTKRSFGVEIDPNAPMKRSRRVKGGCSTCSAFLCGVKQYDYWWRWHS